MESARRDFRIIRNAHPVPENWLSPTDLLAGNVCSWPETVFAGEGELCRFDPTASSPPPFYG